jgi:phosphate transport system substrate-binding protein
MSQKNETAILILAVAMTAALLGGGWWWFSHQSGGIDTANKTNPTPDNANPPPVSPPPSSGQDFAAVQNVPSGLFSYGGSTSWAPIRLAVDANIQSARPEYKLRYVQPNSGTASSGAGIRSLIDGQLTFAQSSRPLQDSEIASAKLRGLELKQIPVAIDGLAVAVNPGINITGITIEQLKSIYTGKINNWSQVGGPNIPVKPYSRPINEAGTVEIFTQDILGGQPFGSNVEFVSTTTQALQKLAASPGGIYYASAEEVVPQCLIKPLALGRTPGAFVAPYQDPLIPPQECPSKRNKLNIEAFKSGNYPITRNLFVVVKQNGSIEQQAGNAYANFLLTEQGQNLIAQAGFVKIR